MSGGSNTGGEMSNGEAAGVPLDFYSFSQMGQLSKEAIQCIYWYSATECFSPELKTFFTRLLEYYRTRTEQEGGTDWMAVIKSINEDIDSRHFAAENDDAPGPSQAISNRLGALSIATNSQQNPQEDEEEYIPVSPSYDPVYHDDDDSPGSPPHNHIPISPEYRPTLPSYAPASPDYGSRSPRSGSPVQRERTPLYGRVPPHYDSPASPACSLFIVEEDEDEGRRSSSGATPAAIGATSDGEDDCMIIKELSRSGTPVERSIKPVHRTRTPVESSSSPYERSRKGRHRPRTQVDRSRSPRQRSRTPVGRSRSPRYRSRSPRERSLSPYERSRSPRYRPRSPVERSRTPEGRSWSTRFRPHTPVDRPRTPTTPISDQPVAKRARNSSTNSSDRTPRHDSDPPSVRSQRSSSSTDRSSPPEDPFERNCVREIIDKERLRQEQLKLQRENEELEKQMEDLRNRPSTQKQLETARTKANFIAKGLQFGPPAASNQYPPMPVPPPPAIPGGATTTSARPKSPVPQFIFSASSWSGPPPPTCRLPPAPNPPTLPPLNRPPPPAAVMNGLPVNTYSPPNGVPPPSMMPPKTPPRPAGPPARSSTDPSAKEKCVFCFSHRHYSEHCREYDTFERRDRRRRELGLCYHCLRVYDHVRCRRPEHKKDCPICLVTRKGQPVHKCHVALCKNWATSSWAVRPHEDC